MALNLEDVEQLLTHRGRSLYGREAVTQLEHALQCAQLAEIAKETPETIAACLLHDLGHLVAAERADSLEKELERDDLHQYVALPFLRTRMPDAVLEPIRLHVDAKRYLCHVEQDYESLLSPASQHSLRQQGGAFNAEQAQTFMTQAYSGEAVRLRHYDDLAKVPDKLVPGLDHYRPLLARWL